MYALRTLSVDKVLSGNKVLSWSTYFHPPARHRRLRVLGYPHCLVFLCIIATVHSLFTFSLPFPPLFSTCSCLGQVVFNVHTTLHRGLDSSATSYLCSLGSNSSFNTTDPISRFSMREERITLSIFLLHNRSDTPFESHRWQPWSFLTPRTTRAAPARLPPYRQLMMPPL